MELAARAGKPAVIHAREADDDVAAVLRRSSRESRDPPLVQQRPGPLRRRRWRSGTTVSFSGMITFRNWRLDDAIRERAGRPAPGRDRRPYLAPVPHRGKRNEPAFVAQAAARVAAIRARTRRSDRATGDNAVVSSGPAALAALNCRAVPERPGARLPSPVLTQLATHPEDS